MGAIIFLTILGIVLNCIFYGVMKDENGDIIIEITELKSKYKIFKISLAIVYCIPFLMIIFLFAFYVYMEFIME